MSTQSNPTPMTPEAAARICAAEKRATGGIIRNGSFAERAKGAVDRASSGKGNGSSRSGGSRK